MSGKTKDRGMQCQRMPTTPIAAAALPPDVLAHIVFFLLPSANDLCSVASTCRAWRSTLLNAPSLSTLRFVQRRPHLPSFSLAIARALPCSSPLLHLSVSFCLALSDSQLFAWLASPLLSSLRSLTVKSQFRSRFDARNWPLFASLSSLSFLCLENFCISIPHITLEDEELEENVATDRSGVIPEPDFQNICLACVSELCLRDVDVEDYSLAIILECWCTAALEVLTLEFPCKKVQADPNHARYIFNIYGPNLRYLRTIGPPMRVSLCLKTRMLKTFIVQNYAAVQFDDSNHLDFLSIGSGMRWRMDYGDGATAIRIEGDDWTLNFLMDIIETCSGAKTLELDFRMREDDEDEEEEPFFLDDLSRFHDLRTLHIGAAVMEYWIDTLDLPFEIENMECTLPKVQAITLQRVTAKGLALVSCLVEAAPSLVSLNVSSYEPVVREPLMDLFAKFRAC